MERKKELMYYLWASTIDKQEWDILRHEWKFDLSILDNGVTEKHTLIIKGVKACTYFYNSMDHMDNLIEPEEGYYLELTTIEDVDYKDCISLHNEKEKVWLSYYGSSFNLCLEIWSSVILINAIEIEIDGESFKL